MDPRSEALLQSYKKEVEKLARAMYIQTLAIRREVDSSRINPEDKANILLNVIGLLTRPAVPDSPQQNPQQNA
jgi:hypothetical protein